MAFYDTLQFYIKFFFVFVCLLRVSTGERHTKKRLKNFLFHVNYYYCRFESKSSSHLKLEVFGFTIYSYYLWSIFIVYKCEISREHKMHQIFKYYDEHYCTNNEVLIITTFVICSLGDKIFVCDLYNIPIIYEIVIRWEGDKNREIQTGVFCC